VQNLSTAAQQYSDVRSALALVPSHELDKFSTFNVRVSEADRVESMLDRVKETLLSEAERKSIAVNPAASARELAAALYM
jgi:hypothetical protein